MDDVGRLVAAAPDCLRREVRTVRLDEQTLREPKPLFRKLDEAIVDEELERMRDAGAE